MGFVVLCREAGGLRRTCREGSMLVVRSYTKVRCWVWGLRGAVGGGGGMDVLMGVSDKKLNLERSPILYSLAWVVYMVRAYFKL